MQLKLHRLSLIGLLLSTIANGAAIPNGLKYNNQPIDSLCFSNLADANKTNINLTQCGSAHDKSLKITGKNDYLAKQGWSQGYEYTWLKTKEKGTTYYQYFPAGNNQFWIYTFNNTGGTGGFTGITLIKRINPTTLTTKTIIGGDRCMGGITHAEIQGNELHYVSNLTPYGFIALSSMKNNKLSESLPDNAVSCIASAYYHVSTDNTHPSLDYVEVDKSLTPNDLPTNGEGVSPLEGQLNAAINEKLSQKQYRFTQEEIEAIAKKILK